MSRDDIAALEVIADPSARFQHKLNTKNVNLRWILKRVPVDGSSSDGSESRQSEDPQREHEETATNRSTLTQNRKGRKMKFLDTPHPLLRLDALDTTQSVEDGNKECLINSPRSAFIIFKNGLSVEEICEVSKQKLFNQGLLDGVTVETVQMRINTENERRRQKFNVLLKEYDKLCEGSTCDEVVDAIRAHKYGFENEQEQNAQELQRIPHYAHSGKLDISVLDTDCIDVMVKSRNRTLNEIRRVLNQRDKVQQQAIEKEYSLFAKEASQEEESKRVQEQQKKLREEKSKAFRAKREQVQDRVNLLIASQEDLREQKREAMIKEREVHEKRAKERKDLDRHASLQMVDFRERRRKRAKVAQESMIEERRSAILEKQEFVSKLHERQMQLKKEELHLRSVEFNKLANERRKVIKEIAENEQQEKKKKMEEVEAQAEQRAREFARLREVRQQAKKKAAQARAVRGAATRLNAEAIKMQRLAELEEAHTEKLKNIEVVQQEKHERLALQNEVATQVRNEKTEEKKRSHSAMEFTYIGYMNSNHAKTVWMEREQSKRTTLAAHVRQEREAMSRARDQVLRELDEHEIQRKKRESGKQAMVNASI